MNEQIRIEDLEIVLKTLSNVIGEYEKEIDKKLSAGKEIGALGTKVYNAGAMYVVKTLQEWVEGRKNASKAD